MSSRPTSSGSSNGPKQASPKYRILSRPSSLEKMSAHNTPDLSEFEAPLKEPESEPDLPIDLPKTSETIHPVDTAHINIETPLHPQSMPIAMVQRQDRSEASVSETCTNGVAAMSRRRTETSISTPKLKKANFTPRSESQSYLKTPAKKNTTPSQAYAGPSFHASPAASSLPMPRLLSKSVPDLPKTSSSKAMTGSEGKESFRDQSGGSPPMSIFRTDEENEARTQLLRDIFNQTDTGRKPKAVVQNDCDTSSDQSNNHSPTLNLSSIASSSLSTNARGRHHARQDTDSSIGEVFSFDNDDSDKINSLEKENSFVRPGISPYGVRSTTAPSTVRPVSLTDEQRKATSLQLKKLLLSPELQRPETAPQTGKRSDLNGRPPLFLPTRPSSEHSMPYFGLRSESSGGDHRFSQGPTSSVQKNSRVTSAKGSPLSRPRFPNKHNQEDTPKPSKPLELPASPLLRFNGSSDPRVPQSRRNLPRASDLSSFNINITSQRSSEGVEPMTARDSERMKPVEIYLRNVLKLDIHVSDGVDGIQS